HNYIHVHPSVGQANGFTNNDWVWVESMHGKVRCLCRFSEAVEPGTVWTWNAIGKAAGAWNLDQDANEATKGFLLDHLIAEELPTNGGTSHYSNSDPVTGQAGWYDVRVRIYKAGAQEPETTSPHFKPMQPMPGTSRQSSGWLSYRVGHSVRGKRGSQS
ncbi:MAG TPA: formate dehydrogenase, partial [Gammaproteobacteria bacterium]|nr:formate dehydrogenase [Gammaproteobacteria bacterium]